MIIVSFISNVFSLTFGIDFRTVFYFVIDLDVDAFHISKIKN
jgi:hypothetical protein